MSDDKDQHTKYATAIWEASRRDEGTISATGANVVADAVMQVRDAELDKYKRGAKTLGETIDKQCRMVLDVTGRHDLIGEDGDGDWGSVWDHLFEMRAERDDLRARLAKVEALADAYDNWDGTPDDEFSSSPQQRHQLRAALAPVPEPSDSGPVRATGAIVTERQRCICRVICLDHCRACNYSGRDLEEGCIRLDAEDDEPSEPAQDADREAGGE